MYVSHIHSAYAIWIALYLVHMIVHMLAVCALHTYRYFNPYVYVCACMPFTMCLYVNCIQANMHLIQPLSGNRYIQIHAYTCRYIAVCITYRPVHMRYGLPYIWCICSCICTLYVLQIQTHISIHMCVVCASDTCTYALAGSLMN